MNSLRKLNAKEEKLIDFLLKKCTLYADFEWKNKIMAIPMEDGGMGSLKLEYKSLDNAKRLFGCVGCEYSYKDLDGIDVIVSLNLDQNNYLYELDIWKTDFSKLLSLPDFD